MATTTIRTTHIGENDEGLRVEIVMADSSDLDTATEAIRIRVVLKGQVFWPLASIQKEALARARHVIDEEIQRTKQAADRFSN